MKDELYKLLDELTTGSSPKFESRELNELFARDRDTVLKEELYGKTHTQEELIESLEFWYDNMLEYYNRSINEDEDEEIDNVRSSETEITGTYHRTEPKIGRNDPCPCGSGKKYKNCHGKPGAAQEI
jgi:preprotein translocase subunit SecA